MAGVSSAEQQTPIQKLVQQQFASLFEDISVQLATDKQRYLADPMAYQDFIDLRLRPLWDISSPTRALLGRHNFSAI